MSVYRSQDWDNGFKAGRDSVAPSFEGERECLDCVAAMADDDPVVCRRHSGEREGATPDDEKTLEELRGYERGWKRGHEAGLAEQREAQAFEGGQPAVGNDERRWAIEICKRSGLQTMDCPPGPGYACEYDCDVEHIEVVPAERSEALSPVLYDELREALRRIAENKLNYGDPTAEGRLLVAQKIAAEALADLSAPKEES